MEKWKKTQPLTHVIVMSRLHLHAFMNNSGLASRSALAGLILLISSAAAFKTSCKPVQPLKDLDLAQYINKTWYIQQQQITGYLPKDENYCVTATYAEAGAKVPLFHGTVVSVLNYDNKGMVNGQTESTQNSSALCARQPKSNEPARLLVAPCFLPNALAGDYWVLAVGPKYEWSIISGGQPTVQYADGCTTKEKGTNGAGFWLFSREPVASEKTLTEMRTKATELGFTLSRLNPVEQAGCNYTRAVIKH
jgi:lipocalin